MRYALCTSGSRAIVRLPDVHPYQGVVPRLPEACEGLIHTNTTIATNSVLHCRHGDLEKPIESWTAYAYALRTRRLPRSTGLGLNLYAAHGVASLLPHVFARQTDSLRVSARTSARRMILERTADCSELMMCTTLCSQSQNFPRSITVCVADVTASASTCVLLDRIVERARGRGPL